METIQIKTWNTQVLFEYEGTIKEAVEEAVRQGISLSFAYLKEADLEGADLNGANLNNACLASANLCRANLKGANIENACLESADLSEADLKGANLNNANLYCADLREANLEGAKLRYAILRDAIGVSDDLMPLACPAEGSFVAWKKVKGKLIKLEIPEDAKRSSATSKKCRCSKAKVLAITNLFETKTYDEVVNDNYAPLTYKVGEMVYPDSFDEYRWNECSHGIHFFMDKEEAINWQTFNVF